MHNINLSFVFSLRTTGKGNKVAYTGKVLDIEVLSKICRLCSKETEDSISHECDKHVGSSGAIEPVGVYRIFERSAHMRKLQYVQFYGDGDSKSFDAVKNVYGENSIKKFECIGHIQKRDGSRLQKLKPWSGAKKVWEVMQTTRHALVLKQINSLSLTPNLGQALHASKNKGLSFLTFSLDGQSPSPSQNGNPTTADAGTSPSLKESTTKQ
ncbi:uncharacterized protein TNCV_1845821 [Trichonephila clavipes]|nr:uncharacterized protein TNCV_1845821 [Trichonephila clavipes]